MEKTINGYEGDTILYYSNEDEKIREVAENVWITQQRVEIFMEGTAIPFVIKFVASNEKMKLTYINLAFNRDCHKEIPITKKEMEELETMKVTDNSLHKILHKYFEKAKIDVVWD